MLFDVGNDGTCSFLLKGESEIVLLVNQDIPREASPLNSLYHLCNGGSEGGERKRAWNGAEKNKIKKERERETPRAKLRKKTGHSLP